MRLPGATLAGVTEGRRGVASAPGVRQATQDGASVLVEVGSGRYAFSYAATNTPDAAPGGAQK